MKSSIESRIDSGGPSVGPAWSCSEGGSIWVLPPQAKTFAPETPITSRRARASFLRVVVYFVWGGELV